MDLRRDVLTRPAAGLPADMTLARLITDSPQPGDWNMSVDEALLRSAASGVVTLRFYQWSEPTLSLGYFQPYRDRETHPPSRNCACVRRSSGGGAILHHHELTYSFVAPLAERFAANAEALYLAFHETLIAILKQCGLDAQFFDPPASVGSETKPPFLCFRRRTRGDVLLGDAKICGSAQRRHRGAVLQHGSVILKTSEKAPEIVGIEQLSDRTLAAGELSDAWRTALGRRLNLRFEAAELRGEELANAEEILHNRFGRREWSVRR